MVVMLVSIVTNPSTSLHVAGSLTLEEASATGNAWTYYKNADRTWLVGIRGSSNDALSFYDLTTDVERLRITSDGKLGAGTASPNHRLTLHNSGTGTFDALNITSGLTNSVDGYNLELIQAVTYFFGTPQTVELSLLLTTLSGCGSQIMA